MDKPTTTAKKLIAKYSVERYDLFRARKMLELLGYIQQIRKNGQTYWLLKELPASLADLEAEWLRMMHTYSVGYALTRATAKLQRVSLALEKWVSRLDGGLIGAELKQVNGKIREAYHALTQVDMPLLVDLHGPRLFTWKPPYDELLVDYRISRQKQIENIASLLQAIANKLAIEAIEKNLESSEHVKACQDILVVINMLEAVEVPSVFKEGMI